MVLKLRVPFGSLSSSVTMLLAGGLLLVACGGEMAGTETIDGSSGSNGGSDSSDSGAGATTKSGTGGAASDSGMAKGGPPNSKCGSAPAVVVAFSDLVPADAGVIYPPPITVDGDNLYFVLNGFLIRSPIRKGPATTKFQLPTGASTDVSISILEVAPIVTPTRVVLKYSSDDDDVNANQRILSVPIEGGYPMILATSDGPIAGITVSGDLAYFFDATGVKSVPVTGGSVDVLTQDIVNQKLVLGGGRLIEFGGGSLSAIGSSLIVTQTTFGGTVLSLPLTGGSPTALATNQDDPEFPFACGSDICWWSSAPFGEGSGAIERLDSNGMVTPVVQAPIPRQSVAFDGTNFFEALSCDICFDGLVLRIPGSGGPTATMASGDYVAVDDACVYWSTAAGIFSVVKTYTR